MSAATAKTAAITKRSRPAVQRSLAGRYPLWVQGLSLATFAWLFLGWLNESWFFEFDSPIWLNRYTEYVFILLFGLWRIWAEKNSYTRKRLIVLVACVTVLWWLIPWLFPFVEPYLGFFGNPTQFSLLAYPWYPQFFFGAGGGFSLWATDNLRLELPLCCGPGGGGVSLSAQNLA